MRKEKYFSGLRLLVLDVDGTMTDGGIYYSDNGDEMKKFCAKDAVGLKAANYGKIDVLVLTGRKSVALQRRMEELDVKKYFDGVKNKRLFLEKYMKLENLSKHQVAYVGDDLNDLEAMKLAIFVACPLDAAEEVVAIADYVSKYVGGNGVIRDVVRYILQCKGIWDDYVFNME